MHHYSPDPVVPPEVVVADVVPDVVLADDTATAFDDSNCDIVDAAL